MKIKSIVRGVVPRTCIYRYRFLLLKKHANRTYAEAELELNEKYEQIFGRKINWDNPITYNEKINVAKLYDQKPIKTTLSDKLLVNDWVKERAGTGLCEFIPVLGVYNSVDEIDFTDLPDRYVMKMNNDSGSVFIGDKQHPVTKDLIKEYKILFQRRDYAYHNYEMQYKGIRPKIIIEKFMGEDIRDYKFQCFNGRVAYCQVDFDRFSNHTRNLYDKNWKLMPCTRGKYKNKTEPVKKPKNFEKMWKLAEELSKGFDQVRVDFYDIDGVIYFGEMTFTHASGFQKFHPDEMDAKMGKLWKLDMKNIRKRRERLLNSGAKIGDPKD